MDANQSPVPLQALEQLLLCPHFRRWQGKKTSLKTTLLSVVKNWMKEHLDAAERQKITGEVMPATVKLTFNEMNETYREQLQASEVRPNTKAYWEAGIKLVFRSWDGIA